MRSALIFIALIAAVCSQAQSVLDYKVDGVQNGRTLKSFLEEEEKKHDLKFFFLSEWLDGITLERDYTGYSLRSLLDEVLSGRDISYLEFL